MESARVIRFGVFELDASSGELQKQGRKIKLEGQPVQVLLCLLENPGELVTREELHAKLWPADTFVNFEHGLNAAVKRLRQALNDSADNPRFVETLPRRGYRFIAPVQTAGEEEPKPRRPTLRWWLVGFVFLIAMGAVAWAIRSRPPAIRSLAVLPLENLTGDPSQEYFADGMTNELTTELGRISELRVISRTSSMTYKGSHKSLPEIARELNVEAVIEGSVFRSGNRFRITAQLILASADKHLWAKSYEGDVRDTLAMQSEIARSIAEQIRVQLTPHERAALKKSSPVNPEAYEDYLKGRYFWNKRTADGLKKAIEYFNQSLEKDPDNAEAYAGLADSYALLGDWEYGVLSPKEAYPKAKAAAKKALELDPDLGEAHISLAFCLDNFDWDWEGAEKEFRRGIELNPGYATGHHWYAWHLTAVGRNGRAIAEIEKAQSLDPLSLIIGADLAEEYLIAHRYDDAIKQSRKVMDIDPLFAVAHYELGQAFVAKHLYPEAIAESEKAIALSPGSSTFTSNLAYAYAVSGRKTDALRLLEGLKNPSEIALVYAGLGDHDSAMEWLEKAYAERFNPGILLRPSFDPLRSDPRFQNLRDRIWPR
jgi:TolB-like protein/DNA-binding winged helix-turn-helix (wHTH) protein/Flp pilus assembly protein TadD